jgi:lipase maturation factor 1
LVKSNPFPGRPPHYIRAELYNYEFTDFAERRATGAWWKRQPIGEYLPTVSISE